MHSLAVFACNCPPRLRAASKQISWALIHVFHRLDAPIVVTLYPTPCSLTTPMCLSSVGPPHGPRESLHNAKSQFHSLACLDWVVKLVSSDYCNCTVVSDSPSGTLHALTYPIRVPAVIRI